MALRSFNKGDECSLIESDSTMDLIYVAKLPLQIP